MPLSPTQLSTLRRAFVDICRGYSTARFQGKTLYLKHLSHHEQMGYEEVQEAFHQEALRKGAETEAARLAQVIQRGIWSQAREDQIAALRDEIQRFEEGKRQMAAPSMIQRQDEVIVAKREDLTKMLIDRANHIGVTAEVYARQRLNDHYILHNLYLDRGMSQPAIKDEEFEDMTDKDVQELITLYNQASDPCSDLNLRLLAVQDFFISYFSLCGDSLADFYGHPICDLTYYQVRLGNTARYFKTIMENMDMSRVPFDSRTDPESLERIYISQKNLARDQAQGKVSNVGMTQKDIADMGLQGQMAKLPKQNMQFTDFLKHITKTSTPEAT